MKDLRTALKDRYDAVFASPTDSLFYQNVHHYYDLVEKTPELAAIMDASQREYAQRHGDLWANRPMADDQADIAEELTIRLERFNLYARAATIKVRIYDIIEDYKHSTLPEIDEDPCAVLMLRGINSINPQYSKISPFKWSKENVRSYNRWYEGKRPLYETQLRQFHLMLLDAVEKSEATAQPEPSKQRIFDFNDRTGAFRYGRVTGTLTLSSQMYRIMAALYTAPDRTLDYGALVRAIHPKAPEATKSEKAHLQRVIGNLKSELGIPKPNRDIFRNHRGKGYQLVIPDEN